MSLEPRLEAKIRDLNLEIISMEAVYSFRAQLWIQLCHLLCNCGQVNLTSLCFIYLIYKLGVIILSTSEGYCED